MFLNSGMILGILCGSFHPSTINYAICRPDYQKLHVLRQLFPRVPIMALSATCPPKVLDDIIKALRIKAVVDGNS